MLKGREATPQQIERLLELAQETKTGSFGMPVYPVDPSKKFEVHNYHLVQVEDLPYGHIGAEEIIANPDTSSDDLQRVFNQRPLYKSRLFWPSLEVALGLRAIGYGRTQTQIEELLAITRQWSEPLWRERHLRELGDSTVVPSEMPPVAEHQSFPSAYAMSIGKYVIDLSIRAAFDYHKVETEETYGIEYRLSKQPPQDDAYRPAYTIKDPGYKEEFYPRPSGLSYKTSSRHIKNLGPFGFSYRTGPIQRGEADYVAADLERVKETYSQWT